MRTALQSFGCPANILFSIKKNIYGRPFTNKNIDFNVSHSGNQVICAASKSCRLGIDIEKKRAIGFENFLETMSSDQWKYIDEAKSPGDEFFRLWALKESVIKADGRGLSIPLSDLETNFQTLSYQGQEWFLTELFIHTDYTCYLATDVGNLQIEVINIDF